ncbi:MAG: hypothetical protein ACI9VR_000623 [Cognaticolwellia sp.]|jgi:hypothetical protein
MTPLLLMLACSGSSGDVGEIAIAYQHHVDGDVEPCG